MLLKVETPLGAEIESDDFLILFGNKDASLENLKKQYPDLQFCRMKQVHGHEILVAQNDGDIRDGDAQFTDQKKWALNVITADCTPVMIYCQDRHFVAGIHAGWRGVQQRIVSLAIERLEDEGCEPEDMQFFIGPHIEQKSFEVEKDVLDQLLKSFVNEDKTSVYKQRGDRYLVNLSKIIEHQLAEYGVPAEQIHIFSMDTMTHPQFHSYRRDKDNSGRQISFIALK
jgi:YfiH family protein